MTEEDRAREAMARVKFAGVRPETLVVRSMPFGALIDDETRAVFADVIAPDNITRTHLAYGIAGCVKGLEWALGEIDRLREPKLHVEHK